MKVSSYYTRTFVHRVLRECGSVFLHPSLTCCRHALLFKGIPVKYEYVNLLKNCQHESQYVALNPSHTVPTLIAENGTLKLTQSIPILEYLEEKYPDKPLLPKDLGQRAIVRNLVSILASDVQPVSNLKVLVKVEKLGGSRAEWAKETIQSGLEGTHDFRGC